MWIEVKDEIEAIVKRMSEYHMIAPCCGEVVAKKTDKGKPYVVKGVCAICRDPFSHKEVHREESVRTGARAVSIQLRRVG